MLDGEEQRRCPRRPILEAPEHYGFLFYVYRQYKSGWLPEPGGLNDQPAKLMDAFREIDATMQRVEAHRREQEAARRRRKAVRGVVGQQQGGPRGRR